MRNVAHALFTVFFSSLLLAQAAQTGHAVAVAAHAVVNFSQLAYQEQRQPVTRPSRRVVPHMHGPRWPVTAATLTAIEGAQIAIPPPSEVLGPLSPATSVNFLAAPDNGFNIPPDTQGTVGLNHLMVTVNGTVRIQDRSGNQISSVTLDTFWMPVAGHDTFDPKILYDPYGDRWMFTCLGDENSATSHILVGVSQSSDPTGNWNLYRIDTDNSGINWADYPSMGFNKQWIVISFNIFDVDPANSTFVREDLYVIDKAAMYNNSQSAFVTVLNPAQSFTIAPAVTQDNTTATEYLLETYNGNFNGNGFIRLSSLTGPTNNPSLNQGIGPVSGFTAVASPWEQAGAARNDFAPQSGTASKIDTGDDRMLKAVMRNGHVWASHTVFLPAGGPTRSAVQWWELDLSAGNVGQVLQFGRVDDSSGTLFRAYPTLAVNQNEDMLVGYSIFSNASFATAAYSFRAGTDAVNSLQAEAILQAGQALYFKNFGQGNNRWGDYSNTVVDPTNDLDLWTIQEYAAAGPDPFGDPSAWGTWWGKITVAAPNYTLNAPPQTVKAFPNGNASFSGTLTAINGYGNSVTVSCTNKNPANHPTACPAAPVNGTPTGGGQPFTLIAGDNAVGNYTFDLLGTGSDPQHIVQSAAGMRLEVVDFALTAPAPANVTMVTVATSQTIQFDVNTFGLFNTTVTTACGVAPPSNITCAFTPAFLNIAGATSTPMNLVVNTNGAAPGNYTVTVTGTSFSPAGMRTAAGTIAVTVVNATPNTDLNVTVSANKAVAAIGSLMTFNSSVTNSGPNAAGNSALTVTFSSPVSVQGVQTSAGTCTKGSSLVSCVFNTVNPGAVVDVMMSVRPLLGRNLRATAIITSTAGELTPADNTTIGPNTPVRIRHKPWDRLGLTALVP